MTYVIGAALIAARQFTLGCAHKYRIEKVMKLLKVVLLTLVLLVFGESEVFAKKINPAPEQFLSSEGFLAYHPDIRWRREGMRALEEQKHALAITYFKRSAKYADKASQAMLAEMYKQGLGTAADPVEAYIWMDLAAERGWSWVLVKREKYWAELNEDQRVKARQRGAELYAQYADSVAQVRLNRKLNQGRRQSTGSRTGYAGALEILIPGPSGNISVRGDQYYKDTYWKPNKYWAWQQSTWSAPKLGVVNVGQVENAGTAAAKNAVENTGVPSDRRKE